MLSDKANKTDKYLGYAVNKKTREAHEKVWMKNIQKNKELYIQGNPVPKGLVTYLVIAGPSLDKNVEELKNVGSRGVIVCLDANLEYLINKGITPEYCVSLDASDKIWDMIKPVIKKTKDITLVCHTAANPKLVKKWLGPKFWFSSTHPRFGSKSEEFYAKTRYAVATKDIKKGTEMLFEKNYKIMFPGVLVELPCGGNVTTTAHGFCLQCLKATNVIFVGADFSWETDSHFYAGAQHKENVKNRIGNEDRFSHCNIYKKRVHTNYSMFSFKQWHEQVALQYPYTCINASEGGILGVDNKGNKEPSFGFDTLKNVIKNYSPRRENKIIKTKYKVPQVIIPPKEEIEKLDAAVKAAMDKVMEYQGPVVQ